MHFFFLKIYPSSLSNVRKVLQNQKGKRYPAFSYLKCQLDWNGRYGVTLPDWSFGFLAYFKMAQFNGIAPFLAIFYGAINRD
jgi:hypothetical protein